MFFCKNKNDIDKSRISLKDLLQQNLFSTKFMKSFNYNFHEFMEVVTCVMNFPFM